LLRSISSYELSEWREYYKLEPFGENTQIIQNGIIATILAESNRDRKKRKKPFTLEDFVPTFDKPEKEKQNWEDQLEFVQILNMAFGGKDLRDVRIRDAGEFSSKNNG